MHRIVLSVVPFARWPVLAALLAGMLFPAMRMSAAELPPLDGRTNLAAGRPVTFLPTPNYGLTSRGDTDPTDLTDGKLTQRENRAIWFESSAVGWSYGGRVNLAVDLGKSARIDEIAIRLLGGSPQAGVSIPGWVEALVSEDGRHFVKVAEFSRWREGDFGRFGVPDDEGKAWIHCLRFTDLAASGRWVGLRMYTNGLSAADEIYVFGSAEGGPAGPGKGTPSDFTVAHPQPYFHKPRLVLATNLPGPLPLGVVVPEGRNREPLDLTIDLPPGVEFLGGGIGGTNVGDFATESLPDGGKRYRIKAVPNETSKTMGRLYVQAARWKDGQEGLLRYGFKAGDWESPVVELPIRAVEVPAAPRLTQIMAGMGWWNATETAAWPGALDAWQRVGLNTLPVFPKWLKDDDPAWNLVGEARQRGFFIASIDSPLHHLADLGKRNPEVFHQLADGTTGKRLCPSYRGPLYREEIERFARGMARARPDFASVDIELWGWQGPIDSPQCTRCKEDYRASGLASWDEWYMAKGDQLWRDLVGAARAEVQRAGGRTFEIGGYDFRPGPAYQKVWSVDRQYPEWMQSSQVSTYSCLYPYHLGLIGDEVREDRAGLARSDVLPWLTPGDSGTFPADSLQWALLECYANGARGVWFWSSRVWDVENLIAYNRVVRAIAPIEETLINGELVGGAATIEGPGRLSGIRRGDEMVLLLADYFQRSGGTLRLRIHLPVRAEVRDLLSGRTIRNEVPRGDQALEVSLDGAPARLLHVKPIR